MPNKITAVARKDKKGKVHTVPLGKQHKDIQAKGRRGFVEDDGKFHERPQAAKVANKAKQTKKPVKKLHSEDLKAFKGK